MPGARHSPYGLPLLPPTTPTPDLPACLDSFFSWASSPPWSLGFTPIRCPRKLEAAHRQYPPTPLVGFCDGHAAPALEHPDHPETVPDLLWLHPGQQLVRRGKDVWKVLSDEARRGSAGRWVDLRCHGCGFSVDLGLAVFCPKPRAWDQGPIVLQSWPLNTHGEATWLTSLFTAKHFTSS